MAASVVTSETDDRLLQRARRFEREHEIERQRASGMIPSTYSPHVNNSGPSASSNGAVLSLADRVSGLTTSSSFDLRPGKGQSRKKYLNSSMGYEDAEPAYDPVSLFSHLSLGTFTDVGICIECYRLGSIYYRRSIR